MTEETNQSVGDSAQAAQSPEQGMEGSAASEQPANEARESQQQEEQSQQKKSKGGFQQRIDQLTREKYEAMRRAQEYEARLQQLEQQLQQVAPQQPVVDESELPPMPTIEQFGYDEEKYQAAMKDWADTRAALAQKKAQEQLEQQQQLQQLQQQQAVLMRKVEDAQKKYPDFIQKINDPSLPNLQQVSPAAYEAVLASDVMGDVAYYLASNPAEVYELATLSPVEAVKKIALIEAKFKNNATKNAAAETSPPPSTAKGATETTPNMENLSIEEWMQRRWQQLEKR